MNPAASWRSLKKLLVSELGDMQSVLATADPVLKAEVYGDVLGLRMTYRPADNALAVTASPWVNVCVGGGLPPYVHALRGELVLR